MKNLTTILLVVACITLCGCSTTKKASRNIHENTQTSIVDSSSLSSSSTSNLHIAEETIIDILTSSENNLKIIEYDTSKPVDEATGRPPIKREIESVSKATGASKTNTAINATKGETQDISEANIVHTEIKKDVNIEEKQEFERKSNIRYYAIIAIVLLILVVLVVLTRFRILRFR